MYIVRLIYSYFLEVCTNQFGNACNVNGVGNYCGGPSRNGCGMKGRCQEPYFGSRCQYCKPGFPVFEGQNGTVDIEGQGPICGNNLCSSKRA